MFPRLFLIVFLTTLTLSSARAQSTVPTSSPTAVALAGQALKALAGGTALTDITLQASARYIAGSDEETGAAALLASGNLQSRVVLNLTNGPRTEIRSGPSGNWMGADGVVHEMAIHNCWPDADWFYPGLTLQALSADPGLGIAYVGAETKNGLAVQHLRLFRVVPNQSPAMTASIQDLSTEDIYLDALSYLPLFLDFNLHPDVNLRVNIAIEIQFSNYQSVNGVKVPGRIQKSLNGGLALDLTISAATVNSGLPASEFAVQ